MWQKQIVIPHQTKNPVAILPSVLVSDNNSNTKMANLEAVKGWSSIIVKKRKERNCGMQHQFVQFIFLKSLLW